MTVIRRMADPSYPYASLVTVTRSDPTMSASEKREYSSYKGVMLCNRPAVGDIQGTIIRHLISPLPCMIRLQLSSASSQVFYFTTGKLLSKRNSDAGAFTCGVIAQSIGMNSISLNRSKVERCYPLKLIT